MTTMTMAVQEELDVLLEQFGADEAEVAALLAAADTRGIRGGMFTHPLCRYIGSTLGAGCVWLTWLPDGAARVRAVADWHEAVALLPDHVAEFARAFDAGRYPDLELPELPPDELTVVMDPADPLGLQILPDVRVQEDLPAPLVMLTRCAVCGCTDDRACPGGCAWPSLEQLNAAGLDPQEYGEVCSRCLPTLPTPPARPARPDDTARLAPIGAPPAPAGDPADRGSVVIKAVLLVALCAVAAVLLGTGRPLLMALGAAALLWPVWEGWRAWTQPAPGPPAKHRADRPGAHRVPQS